MPNINPSSLTIGQVLSATTKYRIPIYQRDYRWGETEAQELVEDLRAYEGENDSHLFLGTFIFQPAEDDTTLVIDGQQRLTTLCILLIACRMRARQLGAERLAQVIQERITLIDPTSGESRDCRLIASASIRETFEHIAKFDWDGRFPERIANKSVRRQVNRLRPIVEFFLGEINHLSRDELSAFLRAVYSSYVVNVSIFNEEQALSIFERTNARGMNLEISDLLKNHLFSQRVENIGDRWTEILENSDGTIVRLLKQFYVSQRGYVSKPLLYRKLKELSSSRSPDTLTAELLGFSKFYNVARNPNKESTHQYFDEIGFQRISGNQERYTAVAASLSALREFGIVQYIPVAYSFLLLAYRYIDETPEEKARAEDSAKRLVRIIAALEKHHFINNVICERIGNEVERLYADTCGAIAQTKDFPGAADEFLGKLVAKRAGQDEFVSRFVELTYSDSQLPTICYVFDRLNNQSVNVGQRLEIFIPDKRVLRKSHNIEHFYPQSPRDDALVDDETRMQRHNIGNLLPLYFRDNSSLSNLSPQEKAFRLRGGMANNIQNLPFVQRFLQTYCGDGFEWNARVISNRAKQLAEETYKVTGNY
jgi:hypothetical protein